MSSGLYVETLTCTAGLPITSRLVSATWLSPTAPVNVGATNLAGGVSGAQAALVARLAAAVALPALSTSERFVVQRYVDTTLTTRPSVQYGSLFRTGGRGYVGPSPQALEATLTEAIARCQAWLAL